MAARPCSRRRCRIGEGAGCGDEDRETLRNLRDIYARVGMDERCWSQRQAEDARISKVIDERWGMGSFLFPQYLHNVNYHSRGDDGLKMVKQNRLLFSSLLGTSLGLKRALGWRRSTAFLLGGRFACDRFSEDSTPSAVLIVSMVVILEWESAWSCVCMWDWASSFREFWSCVSYRSKSEFWKTNE